MTPQKVVSLLEILQVYAHAFARLVWHFETSVRALNEKNIWEDPVHREMLTGDLEELAEICDKSELPVTGILTREILNTFEMFSNPGIAQSIKDGILQEQGGTFLKHKLLTLRDRFIDELSTKLFLQIPHSRKSQFDNPLKGWEPIVRTFEPCARDVEEMNKCFALSRYSAAMFHALHVAEWGAVALGDCIGVTDPKRGWGPTVTKLNQLVKAGHTNLPSGFPVTFTFLEQMNREVDTMVLAWRNKVDHAANSLAILPNTDFTPDIAEHIMQSVKVFMIRLMEGMK